ncbi:MAG: hypothetical protein F6K17_43375 [Okeania sp. SIO3C4]|nr:hypothetical protein [Okeania sp. SIO3C4]
MVQTVLQEAFYKAESLPMSKQEELIDFVEFLLSKYVEESLEEIHSIPHPEPSEKQELEAYLDEQIDEMDAAPERSMTWEEMKHKIVSKNEE